MKGVIFPDAQERGPTVDVGKELHGTRSRVGSVGGALTAGSKAVLPAVRRTTASTPACTGIPTRYRRPAKRWLGWAGCTG